MRWWAKRPPALFRCPLPEKGDVPSRAHNKSFWGKNCREILTGSILQRCSGSYLTGYIADMAERANANVSASRMGASNREVVNRRQVGERKGGGGGGGGSDFGKDQGKESETP